MPPQVPRAVDADTAGLILVAADGEVRDGHAGEPHESVDPSRKLFDVTASGEAAPPTSQRAYEFGALATAAQLVGAGQAMLDMSVEYAKQRSQFGTVIGTYQAIKHKLADVLHRRRTGAAAGLRRGAVAGRRLTGHRARRQRGQGRGVRRRAAGGTFVAADPRRHRIHPGARPVAVAAAGAGPALGVGRSDVASRRRALCDERVAKADSA